MQFANTQGLSNYHTQGTHSVKFGIYMCQMTIFRGGGGGYYMIVQPIFYDVVII
jgi:hypothetical protein